MFYSGEHAGTVFASKVYHNVIIVLTSNGHEYFLLTRAIIPVGILFVLPRMHWLFP